MPEDERIACVGLEGLQPSADGLISPDVLRPVETAHRRVEETLDVRKTVRDRGIDRSGLVEAGLREIGLLGAEHRVAQDLGLFTVAIRAENDFDDLLEIEQPE